jgi:DDE superfamily endonuclease
VEEVLACRPELAGVPRSRWWLERLQHVISWWQDCALATIWRTLQRWDLYDKRGRQYGHSPDWEYTAKVQRVTTITWYSRLVPEQIVRLYQDEITYYRRPSIGYAYVRVGSDAPRAQYGWQHTTARRIAGCLDAATGQLFAWQRTHFEHGTLLRFYQAVEAAYPHATQLFLIQDNWSVHQHPDVVRALRGSKITLVALPTYAPWLNPIEKVWRKLAAEVLPLQAYTNQWEALQAAIQAWLDQFVDGSLALLRYVGLHPDELIKDHHAWLGAQSATKAAYAAWWIVFDLVSESVPFFLSERYCVGVGRPQKYKKV